MMFMPIIYTCYALQMTMNAPWELTTVIQMLSVLTSREASHVHATLASQEMEPAV